MAESNAVALTERDSEVLLSLHRYRYLSMEQLRRLHFSSPQTARRRVRLLSDAGYVDDFRPEGSDERLVTLGEKGAEVVSGQLALPVDALGWKNRHKPKDYYFLKHFMAINDFRITLAHACRAQQSIELLGFIPEYEGETSSKGVVRKYIRDVVADSTSNGKTITHTPDGVFALAKDGRAALFFLEVDRGTEVVSDAEKGFLKTIRFYLNYLLGNGYQRYKSDFKVGDDFRAFRVLVVGPTKRRLENIRTAGASFAFPVEHAKRFMWLLHEEAVSESTIFSPIWTSVAPGDEHRYAMVNE
jgi:hypothetical protein